MIAVFVGPSLAAAEVLALAPDALVLPPARQGDVWRALLQQPRAIALIDGVFESVPSVWHHELLDALDAGVPVFGGASMGALRAAELHGRGVVGVGAIFRAYRDGELNDDADVALLHAGPEHGFRAFTVPHVNALHAAREAVRARVLPRGAARALIERSAATFYPERTWERLLAPLPAPLRAKWKAWSVPDLKAEDAREVIRAALAAQPLPVRPRHPPASALVRARRLQDDAAPPELADAGLRRMLLAAWLRERGLAPGAAEVAAAERDWMKRLRVRTRAQLCRRVGLDAARIVRLCEDVALERLALQHASRLVNDGPSRLEAAALEARWRGK